MIIGMAPMALSAEQNAPLGRAVIGGPHFCNRRDAFFRTGGLQFGTHGKPQTTAELEIGSASQGTPSHA